MQFKFSACTFPWLILVCHNTLAVEEDQGRNLDTYDKYIVNGKWRNYLRHVTPGPPVESPTQSPMTTDPPSASPTKSPTTLSPTQQPIFFSPRQQPLQQVTPRISVQPPDDRTDPPTIAPTASPTQSPTTLSPTQQPIIFSPRQQPMQPLTPKISEQLPDDDSNDDTFFVPLNGSDDVTILHTFGSTEFPVDNNVVEVVQQDTTSVTVNLNQQWTDSTKSVNSIFYKYLENIWSTKCYEKTDVNGGELFDTITIECNAMTPVTFLEICIVDDEVLSEQDDATISKCCHSEESVPPNTPTVCYQLAIRCGSSSAEVEDQRSLRGLSSN